jgi:hypothetical protein
VKKNKGPAGIDGMTVEELPAHRKAHWENLREQLLAEKTYQPAPVREHEIAKKDGGVRKLGIPTVLDRLIQQLILKLKQGSRRMDRRRVRLVQLKQWKRGKTADREMRKRSVPHELAAKAASHVQRWCLTFKHVAMNMAMPDAFFDRAGLPRLAG